MERQQHKKQIMDVTVKSRRALDPASTRLRQIQVINGRVKSGGAAGLMLTNQYPFITFCTTQFFLVAGFD